MPLQNCFFNILINARNNNFFYFRDNGGEWKKIGIGAGFSTGGGNNDAGILGQATKEPVSYQGVSVTVYEQFLVKEQSDGLIYEQTKLWMGKDQLIQRKEESSGSLYPRIEKLKSATTYEYDPIGLKIEAPIK